MDDQRMIPTERGHALARALLPIALALLGLWVLQGFVRSLLWAGVLAIAVGPLYERARRRLPSRGHNVLLPLLFSAGAVLLVIVPIGLLATQLGREAGSLVHWLRQVGQDGVPPPPWLDRLPAFHDEVLEWWKANLADPEAARALLGRIDRVSSLRVGGAFGVALLHNLVEFAFTVVALFFLFREAQTLAEKSLYACRRLFGPEGEPLARQIVASIHGTVDGLVLVGLGIGAVLGIGYAIAGAPHPALLGFFSALAAMIPMGATIALAVASLLVLAGGKTITAIVLFVGGSIVIFAADHAIRPALIGGATRLPFLWVLLGILGGVETMGLLGLFLGPAIMAALILLWRRWTDPAQTDAIERRA